LQGKDIRGGGHLSKDNDIQPEEPGMDNFRRRIIDLGYNFCNKT